MKPQTRQVLSYLARGRSLTALQAIDELGCERLAARIGELKEAGYPVVSTVVRQGRKRFSRYRLVS